jgi:hypothetical protein
MMRRNFTIDIRIKCDSRAEYLEALKAIGRANGSNVECRAYVVVKSKGSRNADIRDLLNEPKGATP